MNQNTPSSVISLGLNKVLHGTSESCIDKQYFMIISTYQTDNKSLYAYIKKFIFQRLALVILHAPNCTIKYLSIDIWHTHININILVISNWQRLVEQHLQIQCSEFSLPLKLKVRFDRTRERL